MKKLAFLGLVSVAFAQPVIDPPFADRLFPFVRYGETWTGTPAVVKDAILPNLLVVYGSKEDPEVVAMAGRIAYYLGQWTEDLGLTVEDVRQSRMPELLVSDQRLKSLEYKNLVVVGTNNELVKELGLSFDKPTIKVVQKEGKSILVVGGANKEQVLQAGGYLADVRLNFRAGAYKTFFSFVALRGHIEKGEFDAALRLVRSPMGVSACGKNMALASPMVAQWSDELKALVRHRNNLLYVELPKALEAKDKDRAVSLWREAMLTCYQCHQGINVPQVRRFKPNESVHARHQQIAEAFGLVKVVGTEKSCIACHAGPTTIRGYK
ncbi:MAG: cellulose biosynthesis cyclic di-GMP-binding regulatory protein BcsB [Aquificaceae bacterium]|nr:cellulose biosynthesis cyclic di-GMP-binding regulatory protein BcsB [Aquificaceae bacterium]MCX8060688.1 cellulose biosynthesis cyclic di-GMP-binding regulatory protein BcsB [Aquificaceae bacterium]MDW8097142.1 cellulose biosynthesis cyclic di-GMP-binding regulatory protein BcsB [Aquificaceae bacterium]